MKQLKNLLPVMLLALLAWNCQKEEQQMPPNEGLHFLENKFSLEDFNDPFIKDNLKVNWDRYTKKSDSLSNTTVYEFETSAKGKLENDNKQFGYKYEVLGHNQGDAWDFEVVKILSNNAASVDNVSYFDLGNFSGTIHHYDLKGENTKSKAFEKGEMVGEITGMEDEGPTTGSKEPPVSNEGVWILITVKRYTDMYMYRGGGIYEYGYSVHNSTQHEWAFIGTGGTSSTYGHEQGDVYHGHHAGPSAPAEPEDTHPEEIINKLTGKAKCVYDKLSSLSTNFKDAIQKFDGDFPVAHLIYSIDYNLPNNTTAVTDNSGEFAIEIKINGNIQNQRTVLGLARTFAHETIHAELYRKVRSVGGMVSIDDFPGIYDYYRRYVKDWQHQQMAAHYRSAIVDILKETDNNQHSDQFYDDIAWEGLHNTVAWNSLSNSERTRITNVISNFKLTGNKNCN